MEAGIAIYAAAIATAVAVWDVVRWWRSRLPDVAVIPSASRASTGTTLHMTIVNRGSHAIRVDNFTFRPPKADGPHQVWFKDDSGPIPPSDAVVLDVPLDEVQDWTPGQRLVAEVVLSTGDKYRSKPYAPFARWP